MSVASAVKGMDWEEPEPRTIYNWAEISAELKKHPMEWLKIFDRDRTSVVNAIRQGSIAALHPDLGFEAETRNNERGHPRTCSLYLRWNPKKVKKARR